LIETGQWKEMDRVLVVTCSKEIRIQRLEKDRKMDRSRIRRIFDAQLPDEQRITFADDIIDNDTSLHRLEQTILTLHESYLEIFN
jgi:dephospho-CoA kinase